MRITLVLKTISILLCIGH